MRKKPAVKKELKPQTSFLTALWRNFLSGILVTAPIGVTVYIVWWLVTTIDETVKSLLPARYYIEKILPLSITGFGIIVAFFIFTSIGAFAAGVLGRLLVRAGENLVNRMPLVRNLYGAVKQVFEAVFLREKTSFQDVVLLEYPRQGTWSIGFVTGLTKGEIQTATKDDVLNVFVPTTPNPTSGFLLFVPRQELKFLSMTVEEGIKMVMSAGIITPVFKQPASPAAGPPAP
jgi:Uncharacterized conserved protein